MWRRLRPWLEVALAQLAILGLSLPFGAAIGGLFSLLVVALGLTPPDPKGFGLAAMVALVGLPLGVLVAFVGAWGLAWSLWFRSRMSFGRFLAAWTVSLVAILALWLGWGILSGYLAANDARRSTRTASVAVLGCSHTPW